jgi:hypothetical protein
LGRERANGRDVSRNAAHPYLKIGDIIYSPGNGGYYGRVVEIHGMMGVLYLPTIVVEAFGHPPKRWVVGHLAQKYLTKVGLLERVALAAKGWKI